MPRGRLTANALALKPRVPANRITDIAHGQRTPAAGRRCELGRYFGTGAGFWFDLQAGYALSVAERDLGGVIEKDADPA